MPHKACLQCELLFEVDAAGAEHVRCTQCGAELVAYTPEPSELEQLNAEAEQGETLMLSADEVASAMSSGVVATMAIEGLAAKVKQLASKGSNVNPLEATVTVAPLPGMKAAPIPVAVMPNTAAPPPSIGQQSDEDKARSTRMLDVGEIKAGSWPDWKPEAPIQPNLPSPPQPRIPSQQVPTITVRPAKKSRAPLFIFLVIFVGAVGGGVAAWFLTQKEKPTPTVPVLPPVTAPAVPKTFAEAFGAQLKQAKTELPRLLGAAKLKKSSYLIAGPEGLFYSEGQVTGMASGEFSAGVISQEEGRDFVRPLRDAFNRNAPRSSSPLILALAQTTTARDLLRVAYAAHLAGTQKLGLVVQGETLGMVPFSLQVGEPEAPAERLILRIGSLGFHVTVRDGSGAKISEGPARISRTDGTLDLSALDERLDALVGAHQGVATAVVFPMADMTEAQLVGVLHHLARSRNGDPRFPDVRVALQ